MNDSKLTLVEHLAELRTRLIWSILAIVLCMGATLFYSKELFALLQQPLLQILPAGSTFIATNPIEAMTTYLKVALLAGFFLSSPFLFYQLWRFAAPGLLAREKKIALLFVFFSTLFFVGGAFFGYFLIFPIGFKFFVLLLEETDITLLPQMKDYLGLISKMLLTFGLIFELPVLLILLARIGLVNHAQLARARRYVIVFSFLLAGLLTPGPDILSQLLLALPILTLYEISLLAIRMMGRK